MTFLSQLSEAILSNKEIDYTDVAVILPNKRASRFLQKELMIQAGKTIFSPAIFSINDFIESLSPRKKISDSELLITLYSIYIQFEHAKGKKFQSFLSWGATFLQDINEIDMQLKEATLIFSNLAEIKELETSFGKPGLSKNQQNYLEFYIILKDIYLLFCEKLRQENTGYEGFIYKEVAENIETYSIKHSYKRYIFAGFNALAPSEMEIIHYYYQNMPTELYFDLDHFYFHNERVSNFTYFIDKLAHKLKLKEINWIGDHFAFIPKEINVIAASKQINQILYAVEILNKMSQEELDHTALIFADETLLLPFVHIYDCTKANLTMGYPLSETPAYQLLNIILEIAKNSERFKENQDSGQYLFYYSDIFSFFQNTIIKTSLFHNEKEYNILINSILKKNKIFFTLDEIWQEFPFLAEKITQNDTFTSFLKNLNYQIDFLKILIQFFQDLSSSSHSNKPEFQGINLILDGLTNTLKTISLLPENAQIELTTIEFFIKENLKTITIPFIGNAEKGLQIMGLLETRTLDFKNIILLSVNEGILPTGKKQNSLLLHDIKKHYQLPTYQYKDSVYAYHFFRLIQRAEKVHLIYNTDSSDSLAEKSRFINQLEFEINRRNLTSNIRFSKENIAVFPRKNNTKNKIDIPKNAEILEKLKIYHFSPTKLSMYINCPLQFYLNVIEKLELPASINENIENIVIGNVIHVILDKLFKEIIKNEEKVERIVHLYLHNLDSIINEAFIQENFTSGELQKGKLFLATEVVHKNLTTYLHAITREFKDEDIHIIGTETELAHTIHVDSSDICLIGKTDRIDYRNNIITILDYKTGWVNEQKLVFKDMETLFSDTEQKQLFQLCSYAFLYKHDISEKTIRKTPDIACGIVSFQELLKNNQKTVLFPKINHEILLLNDEFMILFEENLQKLLANIFNNKIPFSQTSSEKNCEFCDYRIICGRI